MSGEDRMAGDGVGAGGGEARRRELVRRVERLEGELADAEATLRGLGGDPRAGLHLVIEAAGSRAVLPASRIRTVVPLLALQPVPGAAPEVVGAFLLRGEPVTVVDLARRLGVEREPALEAVILVMGGARGLGLLVDRVLGVEDRLERFDGDPAGAGAWAEARLVAGLCRRGDEVLPVLEPRALSAPEGAR